ncbi:MAG: LysE family translocator [Bacteroidales bacterium]|jgi:threonine/homoserine/homoserine lactone efflux protein|nr:LysE family translocator [Bacteroidales bacterium]
MQTIFEGIILGLTLSVFFGFGPALVAMVQTSILRGFWAAVFLAFGVFLSDAVLVALGFFGAVQIFESNKIVLGIIGGTILIIFGIVTYRRRATIDVNSQSQEIKQQNPYFITYLLKGFFINFTNPFIWIFWMGVVVGFTANYQADVLPLVSFFTATLGTVFLIDVLKIFSAYKIKRYIQSHNIIWINRIAGVGLVIFGIYLVIRTYVEMAY